MPNSIFIYPVKTERLVLKAKCISKEEISEIERKQTTSNKSPYHLHNPRDSFPLLRQTSRRINSETCLTGKRRSQIQKMKGLAQKWEGISWIMQMVR